MNGKKEGGYMRKELNKLVDQKVSIIAYFQRYGLKNNYIGGKIITMCLENLIILNYKQETTIDHCWINVGKTLQNKNIKEGSKIEFNAWVKSYLKGYINYKEGFDTKYKDIGINRVSAIKVLEEGKGINFKNYYNDLINRDKFVSNKYIQ